MVVRYTAAAFTPRSIIYNVQINEVTVMDPEMVHKKLGNVKSSYYQFCLITTYIDTSALFCVHCTFYFGITYSRDTVLHSPYRPNFVNSICRAICLIIYW